MKNSILTLIFLLAALCSVSAAAGRTIYVDADGSAEFDNIQAAINDANDRDTIIVADGTYYENINFAGKNIILCSTDPMNPGVVSSTIIDGNYANSVVTFSGTESSDCVLRGFTITNGNALEGGGIYGNATQATIENNNITSNSAQYGGGLSNCNGTIQDNTISENYNVNYDNRPPYVGYGGGLFFCDGIILNNIITDNTANDGGGGLYKCNGTIEKNTFTGNSAGLDGGGVDQCNGTIQNNTFSNNSARFGAGLGGCGGTIRNNIISNNVSSYSGGGLSGCDGTIQNNIIKNNTAIGTSYYEGYGGGLSSCIGTIQNNIIIGNSAKYGGGLYQCGGVLLPDCAGCPPTYIDATIRNNIVTANSAHSEGGGLCYCRGSIENNTIYGNTAGDSGGGLRYCGGTIRNCIIWKNTVGDSGNQLSGYSSDYCAAPSYCCIQDWMGGGEGNIDADPCFADANNGDYHLKSQAGRWAPTSASWVKDDVTSLCIDAGDPMFPIGPEPFPNGGRVNMGAYGGTVEASKSYFGGPLCETIVAGDINGDCKVNFLDFRIMAFHWLERPNQPPVVYITTPPDGAEFWEATESVWIGVDAWDVDGWVVKVEFFIDGYKHPKDDNDGTDGWCVVTSFNAGTYILTARATDNYGAMTTSLPVTITATVSPPTGS